MFLDDAFQYVPHLRSDFFDHSLGALDVVSVALLYQLFHYERLEQLEGHLLRKSALVELKLRSYYDYGTSRIVYTLTQQVLSESSLLSFEHVGQRFKRSRSRTGYGSAASAVVYQRVYRFLQHSLFVSNYDVRRAQLQESVEPVVSVYYSSVQVVQVGSGESASVQLHHRSDVRRNYGNHVQYHPVRSVARKSQRFDYFKASYDSDLLLSAGAFELCSQVVGKLIQIYLCQQGLDGLCSHGSLESVAVLVFFLPVLLFCQNFFVCQICISRICHYICGKVKYLFQISRSYVQAQPHSGRNSFKIPYMRYRSGQTYVTHPLSSNLSLRNFDAAAVTYYAFISDSLILSAVTFPVLHRSEDPFAEKSVSLRFKSSVVDSLRLGYFAVRPFENLFR
ncbi:predicted protein [Firmicutes bacterium CAG:145]|nr:predicted protein [Firmicutes bacterium CAG:145]